MIILVKLRLISLTTEDFTDTVLMKFYMVFKFIYSNVESYSIHKEQRVEDSFYLIIRNVSLLYLLDVEYPHIVGNALYKLSKEFNTFCLIF